MSVIRIHKNKDYTMISNVHLRDKRISLKAKGLLTLMLSLPEDWDYSIAGLAAICKEGKDAIQTTLNELEQFHYLRRTMERNEKGQFECIYEIFEVPQEDPEQSKNSAPEGSAKSCPAVPEKPRHKNHTGKSITENQPPDTYKQNTKNKIQKQNKKTKNTEKEKICLAVIAHLNEIAGTNYRTENKKTQSLIAARLREGYTLDDFIRVIDKKHGDWTGTDFIRYLRPSTLFGEKFEGYLNAPDKPCETVQKSKKSPEPHKPDILDRIF